ncbi:ankyrin repeat domain-containing protein [Flavobacterium sp.]|uniref:ankyrin repeat domain-containing protein n=1 Tax=Flavobacterium sp. TaxID=239 RepID=UPI002632270B|nr:ankyrin repeat domain-containing protein [Flavobacterium sp.]MDD3005420.1 ankyrin repeat domain-containing protein [Flavobacterium sp.]
MKKIFFLALLLTASISHAQNTLLEASFWKNNPKVSDVQAEIKKGNSPSAANKGNFDVVSVAINNDASLEVIKFLMKQEGNDVKKPTHDGRIYLHWAATKGNVELIKYLVSKKSDINRTDDKGAIPIAYAASNGQVNPEVYEIFFKAGNNPKQKFKNGANLLHLAIFNDKDLKLAEYLSKKGLSLNDTDDLGNSTFNYAAKSGDVKLLSNLLQKGVKYDGRALIIASQGTRALSSGLDTYKYLVEDLKLDPNSLGDNGENVLHNLFKKPKQEEIISYFIERGTDINHIDNEKNTVLMSAAKGSLEYVKLYFHKMNNINTKSINGQTALSIAVEGGSSDMVDFLLKNKADIMEVDKNGNNLVASWIESYKPLKKDQKDEFKLKYELLRNAGLNFLAPQRNGNTLYHLAVAKNNLDLVKQISMLGANINAKNAEGMTALHKMALIAKDDQILKFLIEKGANKELKTEFDETAFELAKENEYLKANRVELDFLK